MRNDAAIVPVRSVPGDDETAPDQTRRARFELGDADIRKPHGGAYRCAGCRVTLAEQPRLPDPVFNDIDPLFLELRKPRDHVAAVVEWRDRRLVLDPAPDVIDPRFTADRARIGGEQLRVDAAAIGKWRYLAAIVFMQGHPAHDKAAAGQRANRQRALIAERCRVHLHG